MHHYNFPGTTPTHKYIYVLPSALNGRFDLIDPYFIKPFVDNGGNLNDITILYLTQTDTENAKYYKTQLSLLDKLFVACQPDYVYITNAQLFSKLTGRTKPTRYYGLPLKCVTEKVSNTLCYIGINPTQALTSDMHTVALTRSTDALVDTLATVPVAFSPKLITSSKQIFTVDEAISELQEYFKLPKIACDIETKGLKHTRTGVETIAFAKSPTAGFAIAIDRNEPAIAKRLNQILASFFKKYKGIIVWHGGKFDRRMLTHNYYSIHDSPMYNVHQHEDTMVKAYCCLNSVEKPSYRLKDLSFEFTGDYGIDVKDTTIIPINELLDYNITDACGTFWLDELYSPMLVEQEQKDVYYNLLLPSLNTLIKTELHGIPVSPTEVKAFIEILTTDHSRNTRIIQNLDLVKTFTQTMRENACKKRNEKLKTKEVFITDQEFLDIEFNPGSSLQLQALLYKQLDLPVLNTTKKKSPSTDKDTLEMLINHTAEGTEERELVDALFELSKCKMIIATFIPILEEAITANLKDGVGYIYGNFNIPGTVSGRLSSSDPNLQNMPSTGTKYAKAFKKCLIAPPGHVLVAVDFDSLEDRIAAKVTQDPQKLKVYTDGFDGHSLRAYYYYPDQIPRMEVTPENINKIAADFPDLRQASKPITFALTYLGTYTTLIRNCGLSQSEAKRIEANYHDLYKASDAYVQERLDQAANDGYIVGAFGFKLRANILKRVLINDRNTPHKVQKILRTLGNMLGQSYGLLNSRAANEVFDECLKQGIHEDVFPIGQIHDAQYFVVKDEPEIIFDLMEILKEAVLWDDLPELQQDTIELSGTPQLSCISWAEFEDANYFNYQEFLEFYNLKKLEQHDRKSLIT